MKRTTLLAFALVGMLLSVGCSMQAPVRSTAASEPLHLSYDINYVDNTTVEVDLLVLSNGEVRQNKLAKDVDSAIQQVAMTLPKSQILSRQDRFRVALNASFAQVSPHAEQVRLVVMGVQHLDRTAMQDSGTKLASR